VAEDQRRRLPEPLAEGAQNLSRQQDQTVASKAIPKHAHLSEADYRHEELGISNSEIRQITHLDRHQVVRLMKELMDENSENIELVGKGSGARYVYRK